jgi:hypothetical protein
MRRFKLLALAALALFAFGAVAASVASAEEKEEKSNPRILVLSGGKITELKAELKGGASKLEDTGGKTLTGTGVTATLSGCSALTETDTNSCKDQAITFTGVKKGEVTCRSESTSGKDAIETVLGLLDLSAAAEETATKVLQPLLLAKVLGAALESELTIVCGVVKTKVKGTIGCLLLPGLTNIATTAKVEVTCKLLKGSPGIQETGTCTVTAAACKELKENPFEANLGEGFKGAGMEIKLEGTFNKDVFIDD